MIEIRSSIFETNSSSVHVLVIPKDTSISVPHKVFLEGGEYGWSFGTECDTLNNLNKNITVQVLKSYLKYTVKAGKHYIYLKL